jgi:hypothetical protein
MALSIAAFSRASIGALSRILNLILIEKPRKCQVFHPRSFARSRTFLFFLTARQDFVKSGMAEGKNAGSSHQETYTENEVLARIESILKFTTDELQNTEMRAQAFERLSEFEAQLLQQQRKISAALENVQKYRDEIEKEWNTEKQVRENTLDLMAQRMKELHQALRAQELLLDYAAAEQKFLRELLIEINNKKQLSAADAERILAAYEKLLGELSRKAKK